MSVVTRLEKGTVYTAHSTISSTATSIEFDTTGFNACLVSCDLTGTGTWKVDVQGRFDSNGVYMDIYDNTDAQLTTGNITSDRMKLFVGIPSFIKIVATEVVDGATLTVRVLPLNV